ncbi:hypothetical protein [Pseudomonas sp. DP-17]|uniref:hypothetical protein n=1 Tax=Pseudomonas sp. DP-17 TaxID=1580486 RepID=UPI001EFAECF1|nr:hypothetical protein [Pseudomonas sp. DP-17]MCG8906196.1 hypothetical protein [Pseudomonas sp. DP-17]
MNTLNRHNPLTWLGVLLLAWLVLGVQLAAPKVASGPFYAATEHHLGVTRWEAAPRLGLDAWTTKSTSGVTVVPKATTQRLPSSLPENLTGYANPADIRFTQNSVSNTFKDGQSLQSTINGLKSGKILPDDLPPIRVFEKDGVIYSLDNRRLMAASQAGVPVKIVPATQAEVAKEAWKMTTPNGGTIICVRGSCQ